LDFERKVIVKDQERDILIGLIISGDYLKQIKKFFDPNLLSLPYARTVSKWCMEYFDQYQKAPYTDIKSIFETRKSEVIGGEEKIQIIETFLESISDKFEAEEGHYNVEYNLDIAEKYFKDAALEKLELQIKGFRLKKDYDSADAVVAKYKRVEKNICEGIDVWGPEARDTAIETVRSFGEEDILFRYPGDLGRIIRPFRRGDFVIFTAPAKRGKCIVGSTQLLLSDGSISTIKEIVENKKKVNVVTYNEKSHKIETKRVLNFYNNGIKKVFVLQTRSGRNIELTENHPLLTLNGWKELKYLNIKERIAVPRNLEFFGEKEIDTPFLRVLAYLIADGGLSASDITFTKKSDEIMDDFIFNVAKLGDKCRRRSDYITVGISNMNIRKRLKEIDYKFGKSIIKEIPKIIFELKKEQIKEFLQVLFTCDGGIHIVNNKYKSIEIEYSTGSKVMIYQIQNLLLRFGIIGKIKSMSAMGKTYYAFSIRQKNMVEKFNTNIGFLFHKKDVFKDNKEISLSKRDGLGELDSFPYEIKKIIKDEIYKWKDKNNWTYTDICKDIIIENFLHEYYSKQKISRHNIENINNVIKSPLLQLYLKSDIFWDEIVSIDYKGKEIVYDIEVKDNHNFIANDIVIHNSWFLIETALLASFSRLNVLFLSFEMPQKDILMRIYQRLTGQLVLYNNESEGDVKIDMPYFDKNYDMNGIVHQREVLKQGLKVSTLLKKIKGIPTIVKGKRFKILTAPAGSWRIDTIKTHLDNLEYYDDFIPDMIVCDYVDIIAPASKQEKRHQLDEVWQGCRAIGQEKNIIFLSASHSNKSTFSRNQTASDITEDSRKNNHITMSISIDQLEKEKEQNLVRLHTLLDRAGGAFVGKECAVLQCLSCGQTIVDSRIVVRKED
jgi:intein/homing endonuclease